MDAGLSFIMANHAKVKANDLVYDPFVGTGEYIFMYVKNTAFFVFNINLEYNI